MSLILPIPVDARLRRIVQLYAGLILFGASTGLLVIAGLGLAPWDVFHQGMAERTALSIGLAGVTTSGFVMLLWIPLRQRPGVGTISNAIAVGLVVDATLALLPDAGALPARSVLMVVAIGLNGIATGLYIGAGLGPGPRDGLMTGWSARSGRSIRLVRTIIEVFVLLVGWLLGGTVGIGTAAYALAIGPLAHVFIPMFSIDGTLPAEPVEGR